MPNKFPNNLSTLNYNELHKLILLCALNQSKCKKKSLNKELERRGENTRREESKQRKGPTIYHQNRKRP